MQKIDDVDFENFIIGLTDNAVTHTDWLRVIRFGLPYLLKHAELLMEIIVREAAKVNKYAYLNHNRAVADDARAICLELKLKFITSDVRQEADI